MQPPTQLAAHLVAQHLQPLPVLDRQEADAPDALLYALDHLYKQGSPAVLILDATLSPGADMTSQLFCVLSVFVSLSLPSFMSPEEQLCCTSCRTCQTQGAYCCCARLHLTSATAKQHCYALRPGVSHGRPPAQASADAVLIWIVCFGRYQARSGEPDWVLGHAKEGAAAGLGFRVFGCSKAHRVLGHAEEGAAAGAHAVRLALPRVVVHHLRLLQVLPRLHAGSKQQE